MNMCLLLFKESPGVGFEVLHSQVCPTGDLGGPSVVKDVIVRSTVNHVACREQEKTKEAVMSCK